MGNTKYSSEFKKEALRICREQGVKRASESLGVSEKTLYGWQRKERLEGGEPLKGLKPGETAEEGFARQEKELAELREANYILRKALGFMAGR